jgi:hypothetical protein
MRYLKIGTLAATLLLAPAVASAAVNLDATEVRSFEIPEGFNLGQAQIQAQDGKTVISATTGQDADTACTVLVAEDAGATSYAYQYAGGPTACAGVLPHPDGGFFVRGGEADAQQGDVYGFTARIDAEGNEVWALADQDLVDAADEADGGTGSFLGEYVSPHAQMAYSAEFDKLLAFTNGQLNIGGAQPLTQAHVVDADDGRLRVSGQTFGLSGSAGVIAEAVSRTSDGYFLLYIYDAGSQGAHFFSYNGRNSIDAFKPLGEDWSTRYVRQMVYGQQGNAFLLWTPTNDPAAPTNVTVVDDEAGEVWSASFEATVDTASESIDLGLPLGMWVGANHALILYNAANELVLRVADAATGEELGVAPLGGLTEHSPAAIVEGADGSLKLLAINSSGTTVHEFRLDISQGAGGGEDAGGDAGLGDAGSGSGGGGGDEGCATSSPTAPAPVSGAVLAILLAVFTIANRRRSSC